jgi:hypothetical protein
MNHEIYLICVSAVYPSLLYNGYRVFLGVRCGRGVTLIPHPLLLPRSKIEWSYTSTLPKGLRGLRKGESYLLCVEIQFVPHGGRYKALIAQTHWFSLGAFAKL